jgi:hypothetical protein
VIQVDEFGRIVLARETTPRYARKRVVSLEEFTSGWTGGKTGKEWAGADVGAEMIL